jgi:RimJ/RimL family protein N-acetyltransferase
MHAAPNPVPTLTDGVVTLRAHTDDDIEGSWEQCQDPLSIAWTTVPVPYGRDDARRFVREIMPGGWDTGQEWGFAVEVGGRFAGTVSLRPEGNGRAEIAYGSHPWVRGQGHMERALRLLLDWGFDERGLQTVIWWANAGNWASRRLAWKVGFSCDGTVPQWLEHRGELTDAWVGALRREDARQPRSEWLDVPRIVGGDVVLRRHREADAPRVQEACSDERTSYWLGQMASPYTPAHAAAYVRNRPEGMAAGTDLHWVVADRESDRLLAVVSVLRIARPAGEIGYWTHPEARGRGVMTEAVRLACRHAFVDVEDGGLGLERLVAYVAVDNLASRHVLEANGFRPTGVQRRAIDVRDGRHDMAGYDLLPGDLLPEELLPEGALPGPR